MPAPKTSFSRLPQIPLPSAFAPAALVAAVLALGLHALGMMSLPHDLLYDLFGRAQPALSMSRTILVEADAEGAEAQAASAIVERLAALGAASASFLDSTDEAEDGASVGARVVALHAEADRAGRAASATIPPSEYGVHRRYDLGPTAAGPSLAAAGAEVKGGAPAEAAAGEALLRFPENDAAIPRVSASALLDGRVPRELVEGRAALVGPAGGLRFVTPMTPDAPATTLAEYETVALENAIGGVYVRELPFWAVGVLVAASCLLAAPVYARSGPRRWPLAAAGATLLIALATLATLVFAGLYLPAATLLAAQIILSLMIWRRSEVEQDRELRALARRVSSELAAAGRAGGSDAEGWPQLAAMASRLLGLRRSIFLVPGGARLEQAAAVGCSAADLDPVLLDSAGGPLREAAEADGPVPVRTALLRCAEHDEAIYAAPLRGPGGAGFWIFSAPPEEAGRVPALLAAARRAAGALGERRDDDAAQAAKSIDGVIARTLRRLEARALLLGEVLDALSSGVAAFDAAGRVLHMNAGMQAALDAAGLPASSAAPDLLAALSGVPDAEAARIARRALLQGEEASLPARREIGGRRHLVRLSPLRGAEAAPHDGLLLQLVDVTDLARLASFRRTFSEHLGVQLRNEAEAIQIAAELLADPRMPEARRGRVLDRLTEAVRRLNGRLAAAGSMLTSEAHDAGERLYPLDPLAALRRALERATPAAERRRVHLETRLPDLSGLIMAAPAELDQLFADLLALLVDDAREGGRVALSMDETPSRVTIEATSEGFGAPGDRLAAILADREEPASDDLRRLRDAARAAERWGGRLEARSGAGEGFRVSLALARLA